ncbi:LANO_0F00716g1_1 [Lachancea nothofagi CBS 11611]|uniref:Acetylornithine aminotransferase, mitochondrial n=1 Tax=Lachancea nothofagi CBS 11611 TaxID=1266666 RepID=A0A1G4K5I7_9SACH|nr:LANO_0F00716g1_1 [Lachancea nothofagi CBS 11611]
MLKLRQSPVLASKQLKGALDKHGYQVTTYARPHDLLITRGKGSKLYDDLHNKSYVDFTAGIAVTSLGHSNEEVSRILCEQSKKLIHSSNLYYNAECLDLSKKIVEKTKSLGGQYDCSKVFLCSTGTEANEAALKFAKKHGSLLGPKKHGIIAFKNSFHGRTMGALSVTSNPKYRTPFGDLVPGTSFLNIHDELSVFSDFIKNKKDEVAGLIVEPVQGEGGVFPIPVEKLVGLKQICSENDVVVIHDEIQCGMGRTGKLWAHAHLPKEAHPDIFTSAKALGNGFPIAATMVNEKINSALQVGDHGTTYGGNPLGGAVASYVMDVIGNEDFLEGVVRKGEIFQGRLMKLCESYPEQIKDLRGQGLMIGLEFTEAPKELISKCRDLGLLVITAGKSTVRFVPPLTISESDINEGLSIFEKAVNEVYA